ncbi:hypothetical protein NX059_008211 [Plenodomus lindquistii]|nr:hypothetical protein NX059_008211 [Plenodomus lindquistii]
MVFGKSWNEDDYNKHHNQKSHAYDKHYQYFLFHLAPKSICQSLLPGTLAALGFGAAGIGRGNHHRSFVKTPC